MVVGQSGEGGAIGVEVAREHLLECGRRVEAADPARAVEGVARVLEPKDLAVGRVEEGDAIAAEVGGAIGDAAGVALGLGEDVLGAEADLLGLDDAEGAPINEEGVVGWAVGGLVLGDGVGGAAGCGASGSKGMMVQPWALSSGSMRRRRMTYSDSSWAGGMVRQSPYKEARYGSATPVCSMPVAVTVVEGRSGMTAGPLPC